MRTLIILIILVIIIKIIYNPNLLINSNKDVFLFYWYKKERKVILIWKN